MSPVMSIAYNYETAMARYSLKVRAMWRFPAPWRKTSKRNWRPWSTTDEEISVPGGYVGNCLEPSIIACKSLQTPKEKYHLSHLRCLLIAFYQHKPKKTHIALHSGVQPIGLLFASEPFDFRAESWQYQQPQWGFLDYLWGQVKYERTKPPTLRTSVGVSFWMWSF